MKGKITKERIIAVAVQIADRDGYEALSLAKIAARLNIKTPSLYNHISGFNVLQQELKRQALKQLKQAVVAAAVGRSGENALKAIGFATVHFMKDHPGLYSATLAVPDMADAAVDTLGSEIIAVFLKVLEPFQLTETEAIHFIRGMRALSHGFSTIERLGGFNIDVPLDTSIDVAFDIFIKGMINRKK